jgi:predicted outer membrane repeat protein
MIGVIGMKTHMHALASCVAMFAACAVSSGQTTWYVDDDAPGGDGLTWATAFNDLHLALGAAGPGDEVRVGQGTYAPAPPDGDQTIHYVLPEDVALLGGYAGYGAADPDLRDIDVFVTTLTGDLNRDDGPDFTNYDENSYSILRIPYGDRSTVLEGFTIEHGNRGGSPYWWMEAALVTGASPDFAGPTIRMCRFQLNLDGALNCHGPLAFVECEVSTNSGSAPAMYLYNCCDGGSPAEIRDCVFHGNSSDSGRGGAISFEDDEVVLTGCVFTENCAPSGGAVYCAGTGNFRDCGFVSNSSTEYGGAIYSQGSFYAGCYFAENTSEIGGAVATYYDYFESCVFEDNYASLDGGAVGIWSGGDGLSALNCEFRGNTAQRMGGAAAVNSGLLVNCVFSGNLAIDDVGGAIATEADGDFGVGDIRCMNSVFVNNFAVDGGAVCSRRHE